MSNLTREISNPLTSNIRLKQTSIDSTRRVNKNMKMSWKRKLNKSLESIEPFENSVGV